MPAINARNLAALARYAVLSLRYPQLRKRLFFVAQGADFRIEPSARICFGHGVRFMRDFTAHFSGQVAIGNGVFFNRGCHVVVLEGLVIGENCLFGEGVSIHDENHRLAPTATPVEERGFTTAPIRIGSNVWVGAKATILQGVTIGDNAVIGAHTVVTHDVPPNTLALGVPAHIVRQL